MSNSSIDFASRLRAARQYRGLTQVELAERAELPQTSISHLECGDRHPSFENFTALTNALQVSADYLLGLADDFAGRNTKSLGRAYAALNGVDRKFVDELIEYLTDKSRRK